MADLELVQQAESDFELWAVYIEGPDDIIAAKSETEARQRQYEINGLAAAIAARSPSPNSPTVRAKAIRWPYSAAQHAEELKRPNRWGLGEPE